MMADNTYKCFSPGPGHPRVFMGGMNLRKRAVLIVLDGVGVGEMRDSYQYGDQGSHSLKNTALAVGGLKIPNLQKLGLGNIDAIPGVEPAIKPAAAYGKMEERSCGKDSTVGHWEMMGLIKENSITLNQTATVTYGLFGDISGRVTEGPTPVEGAMVSLIVNEATYSDTTGADGTYTLDLVPVGSGYTVTASKGDNSASISNITVANGATTAAVNINIKPGLLFVTFDNGAELSYALLSDDGKVQLPTDPLRTGYQFSGWYTGLHGTGTQLTVDTIMDTNTTFYAYWRITAANASGSNFVFTYGASSPWAAEIGGYADQYAVSGPIPDTGSTSIYTTISGPGYLSFDWYPGFSPQQFSLYVDDICITSFIYAGGSLWENRYYFGPQLALFILVGGTQSQYAFSASGLGGSLNKIHLSAGTTILIGTNGFGSRLPGQIHHQGIINGNQIIILGYYPGIIYIFNLTEQKILITVNKIPQFAISHQVTS
jgi:uncharacterized repeat protein (TIGR02543 family)